eukprot:6808169-Karenia_brevis.AAC.1
MGHPSHLLISMRPLAERKSTGKLNRSGRGASSSSLFSYPLALHIGVGFDTSSSRIPQALLKAGRAGSQDMVVQ